MKTAILISHPDIQQSSSQQFLLASMNRLENVQYRILDEQKTVDGRFDRQVESGWIANYERIIFQFPLYWYAPPATLKQWLDEVLDVSMFRSTAIKEMGVVVVVGGRKEHYQPGGKHLCTVEELIRPFQAIAHVMGWRFLPVFRVHAFSSLTQEQKKELVVEYQRYITQEDYLCFEQTQQWYIQQAFHYYQKTSNEQWKQLGEWLEELQEESTELSHILKGWK